MKLTALPLSSSASTAPTASQDAPAAATSADAAKGFAGMMAGVGHQPVSKSAPKATNDSDASPNDDDKSDRAKDKVDREDAASLLALNAQAAPLLATPLPVATNVKSDEPSTASGVVGAASTEVATTSLSPAPVDSQPATTQASTDESAAATLQALAAASVAEAPVTQANLAQAPVVQVAASAMPSMKLGTTSGSTASFLLARSAAKANPLDRAKDDTDADEGALDDTTATPAVTPLPIDQAVATALSATSGQVVDAGQSLATTGADRQLDLAKDSAWLDSLAHDIASTGDNGGTLRFQLSPQQLGNLQVEVTRGDTGAAVTLTTSTSAAQAILNDARPQLLAEARAHGLHVSDAQINFSGSSASGQGSDAGTRQQQSADSTLRDTGTPNGNGSDAGRQAQQQAWAEPDIIPQSARVVASTKVETPASISSTVVNASETGARYA